MDVKELLMKQVEASFSTEDWYPPLRMAIEGVTADQATWRPEGIAVNTIWETASHLLYYKERLLARLQGTPFNQSVESNDETFTYQGTETEWGEFLEN